MRLWVMGCEGMVGSALMTLCKKRGIDVVGTSHKEWDITQTIVAPKATHVINCAAYTDVDGAERDPQRAFAVNAEGAKNCALAAQGARFLHLSTDYVFSGEATTPYLEDAPCAPLNVYGRSKREGEILVLEAHPKACIVRTSWVFGGKGRNLISGLLSRFRTDKEVKVVSDQIGKPTYCFDLADALLCLLETQGIVHFAGEGAASRYEIACSLLELSHLKNRIIPCASQEFPTPARRPAYSVLDTHHYTALTGQKPRSWKEGAKEWLSHAL